MLICQTSRDFALVDQEIFIKIQGAFVILKNMNFCQNKFGRDLSATAYLLTGVFSEFFELEFVEGTYTHCHRHYWLVTKNHNIIDVLPVGVFNASPLMLDGLAIHIKHLYIKARPSYNHGAEEENCIRRMVQFLKNQNNHP